MPEPADLAAVLGGFTDPWAPRTVATLNDYDVRVVETHVSSPGTATRRPTSSSSSSAAR